MDKIVRNFAIGLMVLVILAPLGLLAVGETFGEWSNEEIKEKLGFVPPGLERLSSSWSAPLPDYAFPNDESQKWRNSGIYPVRHNRCADLWRSPLLCWEEGRQRLVPFCYFILLCITGNNRNATF